MTTRNTRSSHVPFALRFWKGAMVFLLLAAPLLAQQAAQLPSGLAWRYVGSHRGGRVTAVVGIAGDVRTYYMGTPGGGVWKTTDGGVTWSPIFDAARVASIADLAVAPSDPNVIYVATGEQFPGDGVWKSTDAGKTWANIGIRESRQIPSILVDPHDANILYVAAVGDITPSDARGIYKTTDGGKTWRKVFYKDDRTSPSELDFEPGNSHVIYASVRRIPTPAGEKEPEGPDTLIIKSVDAGENWTPVSDKGLPAAHRGRVGLAVAPGMSGKRVFALMNQGLFRSDDGGENWKQITEDPRILGNSYFGRVYVDPSNADTVYVMQTATYKSTDGGRTFDGWKGTPSGEDDHVLWIAPDDSKRILMGTDQGAVITLDGGKIWNSWFNQPTEQFYRISSDNTFPYHLYMPQQDSGSIVVPNRSDFGWITYRDWYNSGAFESGFIAADPLHPERIYSIGWYGTVIRLDRNSNQMATVFVPPANYRPVWETPLVYSPKDPHALYYGAQFVLKTTDEGVTWKEISGDLTVPPGTTTEAAKPAGNGHLLSKDSFEEEYFGAADDDDEAQAPAFGSIQTIAPSALDANLIWAGTTTGLVHVTRDGSTWNNVTPTSFPERSYVNCVEASPHDANKAFAAVQSRRGRGNRLFPADDHPYFFRTRDGGKSWEKIVNGLPEKGLARVLREDPARKGLLYAGTDSGVFVSYDDGDHWQSLIANLPAASYTDMLIHGDDLAVASFGRGVYLLDDITPIRQWTPEVAKSNVKFFEPETATRVRWDDHPDTPLQPGTPAAANPPDGAILNYYFASVPKGEVTLDIRNDKGELLRHYSSIPQKEDALPPNVPNFWFAPPAALPVQAGINRFTWNLEYPAPETLAFSYYGQRLKYVEYDTMDHAIPGHTPRIQPGGPYATPGTYDLTLTVEGKPYHQKLKIVEDPRVRVMAGDLEAQLGLSRKICELMNASAAASNASLPLIEQFAERKKAIPANAPKEFTDAAAAFEKQLDAATDGSGKEPGFGPINRDLGRYLIMVQSADIRPGESAHNAVVASCNAFAKDVDGWNKLVAQGIPDVNKALAGQNLPALNAGAKTLTAPACTF